MDHFIPHNKFDFGAYDDYHASTKYWSLGRQCLATNSK